MTDIILVYLILAILILALVLVGLPSLMHKKR